MRKFKIRYIIMIFICLVLSFNDGNRTFIRRFIEQNKLQTDIKNARCQNDLLKKRIYYLENESSYLEKMVRSELNVIAPGEIEYRFLIKN
ncbi:MAG: septum formation initiator family protein [Endomicrobium sp.]|jgi:cell division protein FtsB|nr:septum formation initiator family protein [Endomicrobium sp.]